MKIVKPLPEHVHIWVEMARKFDEELLKNENEDWGFNAENCEQTYFLWIQNQIGFLLKDGDNFVGAIACIVAPHFFNYDYLYCDEAMFYIKPGYRGNLGAKLLIKAVEEDCQRRGVHRVVMAHTIYMGDVIKRFYNGLGYRLFETQYVKDLTLWQQTKEQKT
jgi:GNAT superfamily N-acetyltransferase